MGRSRPVWIDRGLLPGSGDPSLSAVTPLASGLQFMKIPLCLLAVGAAVLSRGGVPMPIDLSVAGDPTTTSDVQWTDTDWLMAGSALVLLGGLVIDLSHVDDRWSGPVPGGGPTETPELPGEAVLGSLMLCYGVCASRRRKRASHQPRSLGGRTRRTP